MNTQIDSRPLACPKCQALVYVHGEVDSELASGFAAMRCPNCARRRKRKQQPITRSPMADP